MNKLTKNIIWLNLEKIITFTVIAGMVILTIACATSCSSTSDLTQYHHHKAYPCVFTK